MSKAPHRTPRASAWAAIAPGFLTLLAGALVTPSLVARLSPDHALSPVFVERIQWLRFACALFGTIAMAASLWRRGRAGTALLAFARGTVPNFSISKLWAWRRESSELALSPARPS